MHVPHGAPTGDHNADPTSRHVRVGSRSSPLALWRREFTRSPQPRLAELIISSRHFGRAAVTSTCCFSPGRGRWRHWAALVEPRWPRYHGGGLGPSATAPVPAASPAYSARAARPELWRELHQEFEGQGQLQDDISTPPRVATHGDMRRLHRRQPSVTSWHQRSPEA